MALQWCYYIISGDNFSTALYKLQKFHSLVYKLKIKSSKCFEKVIFQYSYSIFPKC